MELETRCKLSHQYVRDYSQTPARSRLVRRYKPVSLHEAELVCNFRAASGETVGRAALGPIPGVIRMKVQIVVTSDEGMT